MMQISENRLYTSSELEKEVHIESGISAMIFDDGNILEQVTFGAWASLKYFGYFSQENRFEKTFDISGGDARCGVYSLLSSRGEKITAKIDGKLTSSNSFLDMYIVSFVSDKGVIDLDGIVNIVKNVEKVEGYLTEENIFLGSSGKVRGLPTLLVHSDDVKASHACNMERISDEKLFYLRARGLPREDATVIMLESYIAKIFGDIQEVDENLYNEVKENILERVK
jgi:Fe-S cluster assembly scaffold protein SufB